MSDRVTQALREASSIVNSAEQVRDHHDEPAYQIDGDSYVRLLQLLTLSTHPDPTPESAVCDEPKLSCCGGTRKEPNTVQSFGKRVMCSDPCHGTGHKEA